MVLYRSDRIAQGSIRRIPAGRTNHLMSIPPSLVHSRLRSFGSCSPRLWSARSGRFGRPGLGGQVSACMHQPDNGGMPWPARVVGRAAELAELEGERRRAAAGEFRCVLLQAEPGVGKTRLASEFLA